MAAWMLVSRTNMANGVVAIVEDNDCGIIAAFASTLPMRIEVSHACLNVNV
jgi:hypothetical protein